MMISIRCTLFILLIYCLLPFRYSVSWSYSGTLSSSSIGHYGIIRKRHFNNKRKQQQQLYVSRGGGSSIIDNNDVNKKKPILVVGGTGRVGRIVVEKLILEQNHPVRILVRNITKAEILFRNITSSSSSSSLLEIFQADLGKITNDNELKTTTLILEDCVNGCDSIISVSGVVRFSNIFDFLPWRIFNVENSTPKWAKYNHPYYGNYISQKILIDLGIKYNIKRYIRLTGLGLAYSSFNPFTLLFNTLLSCNNVWGLRCEEALINSKIPYIILRPGGLAENKRNITTTNIQIDSSGILPFPARIGRDDVADLCVSCITSGIIPYNNSYTLACRWVGENIQPSPQGIQSDGYTNSIECLKQLVKSINATAIPATKMKPYGIAVGITVYTITAIILKLMSIIFVTLKNIFFPM